MSRFRVARQVRWAVEATGVTIVSDATGAVVAVGYPEAAIWDLVTRGEPLERMAAKVGAIAGMETEAARALILETVKAWWDAGYVTPEDSDG